MTTRVVTKIGYVYQTKTGHLLQLVAIDHVNLNSDVVVVYKNKNINEATSLHNESILFYHHTTVSQGVREGLWHKVGIATIPDTSVLIFKQYINQEMAEIEYEALGLRSIMSRIRGPVPFWYVWTPNDKKWKKVTEEKGYLIQAEDSGITPASDIIYRITHGKSEFRNSWDMVN